MIRYTETTTQILDFIGKYGFITSKICANVFYKQSKFPKEQSQRKLKSLTDNNDIVSNIMGFNKELIYQFNKRSISEIDYYLLNLISEIYKISEKVEIVNNENPFNCHCFIVYEAFISNELCRKCLIVDFEKYQEIKEDKYDLLYKNLEFKDYLEKKCKLHIFPDIVMVNYNGKVQKNLISNSYRLIAVDYKFNELKEQLLGN